MVILAVEEEDKMVQMYYVKGKEDKVQVVQVSSQT
jgi:hypothetical protein